MRMPLNGLFPLVRLNEINFEQAAIRILPEEAARRLAVVPMRLDGNLLTVACTDPTNQNLLHELEMVCRREIQLVKASFPEIHTAINRMYQNESGAVSPDLGETLFRLGYLSQEGLKKLKSLQKDSDQSAFQLCREQALASEEQLAEAGGIYCSVPYLPADKMNLPYDLSFLIPWEMATQRQAIPLMWLDGMLVVGTPELQHGDRFLDIAESLKIPVQPVLCTYSDWKQLYRRFYLRGIENKLQKDLDVVAWLVKNREIPDIHPDTLQTLVHQTGRSLEQVLISRGICTRSQWLRAVSQLSGMKLLSEWKDYSKGLAAQENLAEVLPRSMAHRFSVLPLKVDEDHLFIAISEPDPRIIRLAEGFSDKEVTAFLLAREEIEKKLNNLYFQKSDRDLPVVADVSVILTKLGFLTKEKTAEIRATAVKNGISFSDEIVHEGLADENDLAQVLSLQTGIPYTHLDHVRFESNTLNQIPASLAYAHAMLPIWSTDSGLGLAVADPFNAEGFKAALQSIGKKVQVILAPRQTILASLQRLLGRKAEEAPDYRIMDLLKELVGEGILTQQNATQAMHEHTHGGVPLDRAISKFSRLPEKKVAQNIAKAIGTDFVELQLNEETVTRVDPLGNFHEKTIIHDPIEEKAARLFTFEEALNFSALPIQVKPEHVVVAFADPIFTDKLNEIETRLQQKIRPVFALRNEIEDGARRILGKKNIGTHLLLDGVITRGQLNDALEFAKNSGVRIGKALVNRGYVTEKLLYTYLAQQTSLPLYHLEEEQVDQELARAIPRVQAREFGILPIRKDKGRIILGTIDPFNTEALEQAKTQLGEQVEQVLITENDLESALEDFYKQDYLSQSISDLLERAPQDSAYRVLSTGQIIGLVLFALISAAWIWWNFTSYIILLNAFSTLFYITFSTYRFRLVYKALSHHMEVPVTQEEIQGLNDRDLPVYTLLVPVYKEAEVLPELLESLKKLDYPTTKLDILILMEEDDQATIDAFNIWNGPAHFRGLVVPFGQPKTKPKACNYGLIHARGDYVVIFDAEDVPQPDQLKKIIVAFSKSPPEVVCIQSKLNYYNMEQNLLTRWFTIEYSMWFDLLLPGLSASNAPIPLGGTSNHFKKAALVEVGAWDPYNVTEDADLGVRLFKRGYKTAIVDSTTFEEANSQIGNWIRQRSRWIKGYMQTWLVHMRHPFKLMREIGFKGFMSFQFIVGSTFFAALLNPVYWMLTTLWFFFELQFIQIIYPGLVFFLGVLCLFIGNFAFTYMNVAGALRRGLYSLIKVALISPIYWGLASVAAWVGFSQLLYKPHFWEKTKHGFYVEPKQEEPSK